MLDSGIVESNIVDVVAGNVQSVVSQSMQKPVIFAFWSQGSEPSLQLMSLLQRLPREQANAVVVARVNVDEQQPIAVQFGVQGLPALKLVHQGQLAGELSGPQTEASLQQWFASTVATLPTEEEQLAGFLEQVQLAIEQGQGEQAEQALRQAIVQEPDKHLFRAALVEYLLGEGRLDEGQSLLAEVLEDVAELRPFRNRFALLEEVKDQPAASLLELAAKIAATPTPEDLHAYGLRAAAAGQFEVALQALIQLLKDFRDYRDGAAQAALLKVFDCLPKGDPLASAYRRKMFNYLH